MSSKRYLVAVVACAAQAVLGTACTDVGVVPEVPEEGEGMAALDGPQASWAGGLFPDPENDPRCELVGSKGGVDEYRCETRTTPLTRNGDDIWFICRYRVQIYNNGGQIVITFDLLRCWTSDPGEGGEEEASLTLDCGGGPERDKPAIRGSEVNCAVSLEGGNEDASGTVFEWESEHATWTDSSDTGGSWGGVATDITVTVITGDEAEDTLSETVTVSVEARPWPLYDATYTQSSPAYVHDPGPDIWGAHEIRKDPSLAKQAGSGPWDGTVIIASRPYLGTVMWLHTDFRSNGQSYGKVDIHSPAHRCVRGLGSSANVYEMNDACSTLGILSLFHDKVLAHEKKHETSLNECLASQTAEDWQSELEALVGKGSDGSETLEAKWNDFLDVLHDANEGTVAGDRSDSAMWHRAGRLEVGLWVLDTVQTDGHSGTDGC